MSDVLATRALPPARPKWLLWTAGVAVVAAVLVLSIGGIGENLVYYWGPTELQAAGDKAYGATIRLGGLVAPGSVKRTPGASGLEFDVIDRQGALVHVKSTGVPPQMFREKIGVVVEGTMTREGHFRSNRLMVSHDNEYRVPGEGKADVKELMRSTRELSPEAAPRKP